MTSPTIESTSTTDSGSNFPDNADVTLPTGISSGDLILIFFITDGASVTHTASGYTTEHSVSYSGHSMTVFSKSAAGGETTINITWGPNERWAQHSYRISGWNDFAASTSTDYTGGNATSTPDFPSLTPSWGSADTLWFCALTLGEDGDTAESTDSPPTNFDTSVYSYSSVGNSHKDAIVCLSQRFNTTATENPGTWNIGATPDSTATTFAVEPSAAAAGSLVVGRKHFYMPHTDIFRRR